MIRALPFLLLAACSTMPDLPPRAPNASSGWPELAPVGALLAQTAQPSHARGAGADLASRASALRARAAALRAPVLTASERARLSAR